MGSVAIDRALPRTRDAEAKVRPNSEIVLVVVTDDYDGAVNRILFSGDSTPSDGDEVTISYQRWIGGTIGCESDDDCPIKFFCRDGECI